MAVVVLHCHPVVVDQTVTSDDFDDDDGCCCRSEQGVAYSALPTGRGGGGFSPS